MRCTTFLKTACFLLVTTLFLYQSVFSIPYDGECFPLKQPDGSLVRVRVYGDDYYQRVTSMDGYTLVRNEQGWICYAQLAEDGLDFVATELVYTGSDDMKRIGSLGITRGLTLPVSSMRQKANERMKYLGIDEEGKRFLRYGNPLAERADRKPVVGDIKGITILVDFSDEQSSISQQVLADYVNKKGFSQFGNNGSVHDYFYDVSGGKLNYTNHVTAFYRARNPKGYYDHATNPKARELVLEALRAIDQKGFDFSTLTTNSSKRILAINILYAGYPEHGWAKGLWPHMNPSFSNFSADGVQSMRYQMTNIGDTLRLGTFCHENGHMVGEYPDLYDYGGESRGVGTYCLMCRGGLSGSKYVLGFNPMPPCAPFRDIYTGWDQVIPLNNEPVGKLFRHVGGGSNVSYIYKNPSNQRESFYIESLIRKGRYEKLFDEGLAFWHYDSRGSNNNEQMTSSQHYLVSLEQADGRFDLEKTKTNDGDTTDLFHKGYKTTFSDATKPDAKWWNGSNSNLIIGNISEVRDTMYFTIGDDPTGISNQNSPASHALNFVVNQGVTAGNTKVAFSFNAHGQNTARLFVYTASGRTIFTRTWTVNGASGIATQSRTVWDTNAQTASGSYIAVLHLYSSDNKKIASATQKFELVY